MNRLKQTLYIVTIVCTAVMLPLIWTACSPAEMMPEPTASAATPTPEPAPPYSAEINQPVISGSAHAVFSAKIAKKVNTENVGSTGFYLSSDSGTQTLDAAWSDGVSIAIIDSLEPDTAYQLSAWVNTDETTFDLGEAINFNTPAQVLSSNAVEALIDTALEGKERDDENRLLLETQACLNLMGFETESYGSYGPLTQSNLTRISYSLYSLAEYADFSRITAEPSDALLKTLKDIVSVNPDTTESDIVHTFTPTPFVLTQYAVLDEDGGSLDIETYIMEEIEKDSAVKALYAEYPYDQTTPEFKEMYADIITGDLSDEAKAEKLAGYAAKNKALFSYESGDWMIETSAPKEPLVVIAGSDNEITINTMASYAYLLIDAYRDTGKIFQTSTTYRTCETQWLFYSKKSSDNVARSRNGSWHLRRQLYSYVPGYSNHQYGVAIDFYERNSFGDTVLFDYLVENGANYGFYNYYLEPWHWAYLGTVFKETE